MKNHEREYVKKRKSYYGFAKNYPGKLGSSRYVIGDSLSQKKKELWRKILICFLVILLFAITFVTTSVFFEISEMPKDAHIFLPNVFENIGCYPDF